TSNSERALPDPFLRRCVFHHLEFPQGKDLERIVTRRLGLDGERPDGTKAWINEAIQEFEKIRARLNRKPATAELLAWLRILEMMQESSGAANPLTLPSAKAALSTLVKNKDDRTRAATT